MLWYNTYYILLCVYCNNISGLCQDRYYIIINNTILYKWPGIVINASLCERISPPPFLCMDIIIYNTSTTPEFDRKPDCRHYCGRPIVQVAWLGHILTRSLAGIAIYAARLCGDDSNFPLSCFSMTVNFRRVGGAGRREIFCTPVGHNILFLDRNFGTGAGVRLRNCRRWFAKKQGKKTNII